MIPLYIYSCRVDATERWAPCGRSGCGEISVVSMDFSSENAEVES